VAVSGSKGRSRRSAAGRCAGETGRTRRDETRTEPMQHNEGGVGEREKRGEGHAAGRGAKAALLDRTLPLGGGGGGRRPPSWSSRTQRPKVEGQLGVAGKGAAWAGARPVGPTLKFTTCRRVNVGGGVKVM
jgi:hypothetical protein